MSMKEVEHRSIIGSLRYADLSIICFIGMSLTFLVVGVFNLTVFAYCEAGSNEIVSWKTILAGMIDIGLCIGIGGIATLYWWLVPKRSGVLFPSINGFGLVLMVMSMFSATLIHVELVRYFELM